MAKAAKKGSKKSTTKRQRKEDAPSGDHVRQLAPERAVKSFINEIIATKNATSEAGQGLSTATKRASDQGVNVPAARIAARLYSKAKQDSMKARVLWEDVQYYLTECTDFEKIAPSGMFTPDESGQKRKSKQAEIPLVEESPLVATDELVVTH